MVGLGSEAMPNAALAVCLGKYCCAFISLEGRPAREPMLILVFCKAWVGPA